MGRLWLLIVLLGAALLGHPARLTAQNDDAQVVADAMLEALGGETAWEAARHIRFTFLRGPVRIVITWDQVMNRARVESADDTGPFVALLDVPGGAGAVYREGQRVEGEDGAALLNRARRMWAGETYWFLMPYKLRDPGVHLELAGEESIDGQAYDILHVTFDEVGLTPDDQFWAYVNRATHLMDKWRFRLQRGAEGEFWWRTYEQHGPLLLATTRETMDGEVAIRMEDILVSDALPDQVYTDASFVFIP